MNKLLLIALANCSGITMIAMENELCKAIRTHNYEQVSTLLEKESSNINKQVCTVTAPLRHNTTPLMYAILNQQSGIAQLLIAFGADPNSTDTFGETPLTQAIISCPEELSLFLIEYGANPNYQNMKNSLNTPLMLSAKKGYEKLCRLLIKEGAEINIQNGGGWTPLEWSVQHPPISKLLIEHGAITNTQDKQGKTPLMIAVERSPKPEEAIQVLLMTIPLSKKEEIRKSMVSLIGLRYTQSPAIPRDVRKLIDKSMINNFVQEHMKRIIELVNLKDKTGATARDMAIAAHKDYAAQLLDLNNPNRLNQIRTHLENDIKHILFGPKIKRIQGQ